MARTLRGTDLWKSLVGVEGLCLMFNCGIIPLNKKSGNQTLFVDPSPRLIFSKTSRIIFHRKSQLPVIGTKLVKVDEGPAKYFFCSGGAGKVVGLFHIVGLKQ